MQKYNNIISLKISKEEKHYLEVLKNTYKVNTAKFIRDAFTEKLKKDIPIIRQKYKLKDEVICPF